MIKVKISNDLQYGGRAITILAKRTDGYHQVLPLDLIFAPLSTGVETTPCLVLDDDQEELLYALAQGLAEAGYLPDVSCDRKNELTATKYHLEDMRKLIFRGK